MSRPHSKAVLSSWRGLHMQHRYEDLVVIQGILRRWKPAVGVELGTGAGGFACFLADTFAEWGGRVVTVDIEDRCGTLPCENLSKIVIDCLDYTRPEIVDLIAKPQSFLYCDNGNKRRELRLYAPCVGYGGLLGVHDYGTEVDPGTAEALLLSLGYDPCGHADFERLAHPVDYPYSLTRMWRRSS